MLIGELGASTGVDIETIRYYEKIGLMPAPDRAPNGYRIYSAKHREQLEFIRHCRALDIALVDVRRLIDFSNHPNLACDDIDQLIDDQLDKVRARLANLHELERQLLALRHSCGGSTSAASCGILRELTTASHSDTDDA